MAIVTIQTKTSPDPSMTEPLTTNAPSRDIVLLGAGGHARVLLELMRKTGHRVVAVLDDDPAKQGQSIHGIDIIEPKQMAKFPPSKAGLANAVGSVRQPEVRKKMYERFEGQGYSFITAIHPSAIIADDAQLEEGAQVMAGGVVQTGARVGRDTLVNSSAIIEHDTVIGEHCHIAPGVTVCGEVRIGNVTHIGAGATVLQGRRIGDGCLVGAGAVILHDVPDGCAAWGIPATTKQTQSKNDES
jgi:UDP-perosamine 4-acetyltransferase